ncbi:PASTA domain-containing protein, partial [Streptomyces sp. NPDC004290]
VTGESVDDATAELQDAGLQVKISDTPVTSDLDAGQVVRQSPDAGARTGKGDTVTLTLSKGPERVEVPDVVGRNVDEARKTLEAAGFKVEEDRGLLGLFGDTVKSQSVEGGQKAPKGTTVTLKIR